jgi:hypothetical protein
MDWIHSAQDRKHLKTLVNTLMNLWIPQIVGRFLSSLATGGFSRSTRFPKVCLFVRYLFIWLVIPDRLGCWISRRD